MGYRRQHMLHNNDGRQANARTSLKSALASILQRSAPALALCALAFEPPVHAQEVAAAAQGGAGTAGLEEVVVTGIRQSLESAQEIKRESEVFVDSVTAEDIGALPDRSVTEALQRIPGVAINRFAGSNDPDHFSIEGSGVVVRGLNQVRSELNGRDTFSANNGRFLSFADVPPELMIGVDVFKNQSADMIEGGLAGTVNLRTRVPFDAPGQVLSFNAEANYGDFVEEWSPTGSALYSNRWGTDVGEFGILLNAVYSQLKSRSDGVQASSFRARTDLSGDGSEVWVPEGAALRTQDYDRERTGAAFAAQWQSPDDSMVATLQFLRSDAKAAWSEHAVEIATDNVGDTAFFFVPGTEYGFDSQGIFSHGTITAPTGWRDDEDRDWTGPNDREERTPFYGLQSNNIARSVDQQYVTSDYGLNLKWAPNEDWSFNFDLQKIESTVENLDMGLWASTFQNVNLDLRGDLPRIQFLGPSQNGTVQQCATIADGCPSYFNAPHDSFSDPYNSFWRAAMDHIEDSEGDEFASRFDIDRKFDDLGWVTGMRFGARYADREQTTRSTKYNWGSLSEIWGSGGPVWMNDPADGVPTGNGMPGVNGLVTADRTELYAFDNFMRGETNVPAILPFYAGNLVSGDGYRTASEFASNIANEWRGNPDQFGRTNGDWVPLADARRGDLIAGTPFLPREVNNTDEKTEALYFMVKFGNDLAEGRSISGNIGVRYVKTDFEASGQEGSLDPRSLRSEEECFPATGNASDNGFCTELSLEEREAARRFATGEDTPIQTDNSYDNWLPSLNLKIGLREDLQLRFGFSQAMARPDLGLMRYYNVIETEYGSGQTDWVGFQIRTGNPYLKPTKSSQFDGSAEWYFSRVGSLTFSAFYKELKDVLTNEVDTVTYTFGGETYDVTRRRPINSDETGTVKGFELAYQQFYDFLPGFWSGFGVQANYTYIDSSGVSQSVLNSGSSEGVAANEANVDTSLLPLQGLSEDNVNFTLIYEKGPLSTRVAYSWRSEFLLTTRDVITPFAPIMNEATGQLDASLFYNITDNVKVGFQGVNLTNEITKTSQVLNDDLLQAPRSWFMNDRRYSLVARVNF